MMANNEDHSTTVVSITGGSHRQLHFLANLAPTVGDADSIWSVIAELTHRPEVMWNRKLMLETWLTSMDESPSGDLFAVSMDGNLHHGINGNWATIDLGCPDGLNAVWAASDVDVFAVGLAGRRVRITNLVPTQNRDEKQRRLNAIHGTSADNLYAVGDGGVIFRYNGVVWTEIDSPTNATLLAVLCNEADVYIAGASGTLFRGIGDSWTPLHTADHITITSLAWYKDALYAATGLNGIHLLEPDGLRTFKPRIIYRLRTVGDLLFGFGNRLVIQFDGSGWWGGDLDL